MEHQHPADPLDEAVGKETKKSVSQAEKRRRSIARSAFLLVSEPEEIASDADLSLSARGLFLVMWDRQVERSLMGEDLLSDAFDLQEVSDAIEELVNDGHIELC